MPQLGETVTEGTITRWIKSVGDVVVRDEPLFEVSTDKVDSEVPSPFGGVVSEILVPEGDTVEVGARLAVIGEAQGNGSAPDRTGSPRAPPPPQQVAPPPPVTVPAPPTASTDDDPGWRRPLRRRFPRHPPRRPRRPRASRQRLPRPLRPPAAEVRDDPRILSPVVRRLITDNGIDPSEVTGTGLGGRVTREDVLAVLDQRRAEGPAVRRRPPPTRRPRRAARNHDGPRRHGGGRRRSARTLGRAGASCVLGADLCASPANASSPSRTSVDGRPSTWSAPRLVHRMPSSHTRRTSRTSSGYGGRGALASRRRRASRSPISPSWLGPRWRRYATSRTSTPRSWRMPWWCTSRSTWASRSTWITKDSSCLSLHRAEEVTLRGIARRIRDVADRAADPATRSRRYRWWDLLDHQ